LGDQRLSSVLESEENGKEVNPCIIHPQTLRWRRGRHSGL